MLPSWNTDSEGMCLFMVVDMFGQWSVLMYTILWSVISIVRFQVNWYHVV